MSGSVKNVTFEGRFSQANPTPRFFGLPLPRAAGPFSWTFSISGNSDDIGATDVKVRETPEIPSLGTWEDQVETCPEFIFDGDCRPHP
jgi:urocanate hydratase